MSRDDEIFLALDQNDFEDLVYGREVTKHTTLASGNRKVRIVLSDIGYALMAEIIKAALRENA